MTDEQMIRYNSFVQAVDTHPLRFNVEDKPTLEDLIERAKKIEAFVIGEQKVGA